MTDVLTPQQRKFNMSRIRSRNTRPEMLVRSLVHRLGFRYSLHKKDLPGKPDLVLVRHKKIIEVRGCFFHMHDCSYGNVKPATNSEFWQKKRESNKDRDRRNVEVLKQEGWQILIVWECQTKNSNALHKILAKFLLRNGR